MVRLNAQRRTISAEIGQTDQILARLAIRRRHVRAFVSRAAAVTQTTASKSQQLAASVRRLPQMLTTLRAGARSIDRFAGRARPLVRDLRSAAPSLAAFTEQLPAFSATARPALQSLSAVAGRARHVVPAASKTMKQLQTMGAALRDVAPDAGAFTTALRDAGGFESLLETFYRLAAFTSLYDSTSHLGGIHINVAARCLGADKNSEGSPPRGCSHRYSAGDYPINGPDSPSSKPPTKANIASFLKYLLG
jgi:ABC-type transporter Mla subunit MlaD